jgi:hypothetical protein
VLRAALRAGLRFALREGAAGDRALELERAFCAPFFFFIACKSFF